MTLRRAPEIRSTVTIGVSYSSVRFDVSLMDGFGSELAFNHRIRFAKALVQIATFVKNFTCNIRWVFWSWVNPFGDHAIVQKRRTISHGLIYGQDMRQYFIGNFNRFGSSFSLFTGYCRHGRYDVALV